MPRFPILLVLTLAACGSEPAPQVPPPTPAPELAPEPPPAPQPAVSSFATSLASMGDDTVESCEALVVQILLPDERADESDLAERFVGNLLADISEKQFTLPATQSCSRQFADRLGFATCQGQNTVEHEELQITIVSTSTYYDPNLVYSSDEKMRECITSNGEWSALDRESDQVRRALRRLRAEGIYEGSRELLRQNERLQRHVLGR